MKFLDRPHVPTPVLRALKSDAYQQSLSDHMENLPSHIQGKFQRTMSVTTLARSPRQKLLFQRHDDEIVIDPEMQTHAMLGRVIHSILEEFHEPWQVVEERLGVIYPLKVGKDTVSYYLHGQGDLYDTRTCALWDYKTPKTGSLKYSKSDKVAQLNILAYIWRRNKKTIRSLQNCYLLVKDWNPNFVKDELDHEYPKSPVVITGQVGAPTIPLWDDAKCEEYLNDRLGRHYRNERLKDDDLDECSDEELWRSEPEYRVIKLEEDGTPQKVAKFRSIHLSEAENALGQLTEAEKQKVLDKNQKLKKPKPEETLRFPEFTMVKIPAQPRRCGFCEVRGFCSQRLTQLASEINQTNELETDDL